MAAADAQAFDDGAHHFAGGADVAHVAHGEDEVAANDAGRDRPLGALGLEAEVGHLGDHVLAHAAENQDVQIVADLGVGQGLAERAQCVLGQGRALDAAEQRGAVAPMEIGKGLDVARAGLAAEQLGVALDAVGQRRGEPRLISMPAARMYSVMIVDVAP